MKKHYFSLFLGLLLPIIMKAQWTQNVYYDFVNLQPAPCPGSPADIVITPQYCQIYQTYNNKWNGIKDSNICISVYNSGGYATFDVADADLSRNIFVHLNLPDSAKILLSENRVGEQRLQWQSSTSLQFVLGDTCEEGICTGAWVGIEIPDSAGTGRNMRVYDETKVDYYNWNNLTQYTTHACLSTEKFVNGNFFKELIWKFKVKNANSADFIRLKRYSHELTPVFFQSGGSGFCPVTDRAVWNSGGGASPHNYDANLRDIYGYWVMGGTYLVMYEDTTYPSPQAVSYVEFSPSPPSLIRDTLNIYLENPFSGSTNSTLAFQPSTGIRGALVSPTDTIRHLVNLINNGNDMCMPGFMEVLVGNQTHIVHQKGSISFGGEMACMMFEKGSALEVAQGGYLRYGVEGKGMMGWRTGAELKLQQNATLFFDGTMVLLQNKEDIARQDVSIVLPMNSELIFTEDAKILNFCPLGRKIKIYMKGGFVDISKLKPEYRQHIEIIYDEKPFQIGDNVLIKGNPVVGELEWEYIDDKENTLTLNILNVNGQALFSQEYHTNKGTNDWKTPLPNLPSGIYFAQFKAGEGSVTRKIVLQ